MGMDRSSVSVPKPPKRNVIRIKVSCSGAAALRSAEASRAQPVPCDVRRLRAASEHRLRAQAPPGIGAHAAARALSRAAATACGGSVAVCGCVAMTRRCRSCESKRRGGEGQECI
jgi:hypothetical protein